MATANSAPFSITSVPITLSSVGISSILQESATISVTSNAPAGMLYAAIRTDRAWTAGDAAAIINAVGDWAGNIASPQIGINIFSTTGLTVGVDQYVGLVQSDGTNTSAVVSSNFATTSYPEGGLAPYQLQSYPDRVNFQGVPVYADLGYGWGGTPPITFAAAGLPAGLSMDASGKITDKEPTVVDTTQPLITASNGSGTAVSGFSWQIAWTATVPGPSFGSGMTRKELADVAVAYADRYTDAEVLANMDSIFKFAEARMSRVMRNREMSTRLVVPIVDGQEYYTLPADYAGMRDVLYRTTAGATQSLEFLTPMQISARRNQTGGLYYCIKGTDLQITSTLTSGQLEMLYYQRVPALVNDSDTNWLSAAHPDIYRAGLQAQIEAFAKNDDRAILFDQELTRAFGEIADRAAKDTWAGAPQQIRTA